MIWSVWIVDLVCLNSQKDNLPIVDFETIWVVDFDQNLANSKGWPFGPKGRPWDILQFYPSRRLSRRISQRVTFWSKRSSLEIFCTFFFASPSRRLSRRLFPGVTFWSKRSSFEENYFKHKIHDADCLCKRSKGTMFWTKTSPPQKSQKVVPAEYQKGRRPDKTSKRSKIKNVDISTTGDVRGSTWKYGTM